MFGITKPRLLGMLSAGLMITAITGASVSATAATAAKPVVRHLPGGVTITRFPNGTTLTTAPMHFKVAHRATATRGGRFNGYGETDADCGIAKLWTFASNHTYQLSLIGNPGVILGDGWADTSTDGITEIPSIINFSPRGQTYTSGRVGIWPGLFPHVAATVGSDATSQGDCLIAVVAPWS